MLKRLIYHVNDILGILYFTQLYKSVLKLIKWSKKLHFLFKFATRASLKTYSKNINVKMASSPQTQNPCNNYTGDFLFIKYEFLSGHYS